MKGETFYVDKEGASRHGREVTVLSDPQVDHDGYLLVVCEIKGGPERGKVISLYADSLNRYDPAG